MTLILATHSMLLSLKMATCPPLGDGPSGGVFEAFLYALCAYLGELCAQLLCLDYSEGGEDVPGSPTVGADFWQLVSTLFCALA